MKNIRLKVYPRCTVKLSAPFRVSDEWINDYLKSKILWIEKSLQYYKDTEANELETRIHSGASTRILGKQIRIIVSEAKIYKIEQRSDYIYMLLKVPFRQKKNPGND